MLNSKWSEKNWPFRGPRDQGYEKLRFLLQKAHPCVNPGRLSHFAWKSVKGLTSRAVGEKVKVTRGSHRNDVSPLTQGLRYHAACDTNQRILYFTLHGTNQNYPHFCILQFQHQHCSWFFWPWHCSPAAALIRSSDPTGNAMICYHFKHFYWSSLYFHG